MRQFLEGMDQFFADGNIVYQFVFDAGIKKVELSTGAVLEFVEPFGWKQGGVGTFQVQTVVSGDCFFALMEKTVDPAD